MSAQEIVARDRRPQEGEAAVQYRARVVRPSDKPVLNVQANIAAFRQTERRAVVLPAVQELPMKGELDNGNFYLNCRV